MCFIVFANSNTRLGLLGGATIPAVDNVNVSVMACEQLRGKISGSRKRNAQHADKRVKYTPVAWKDAHCRGAWRW